MSSGKTSRARKLESGAFDLCLCCAPPARRARSRNARCRSLADGQAATQHEQGAVPRAEDVRHGGARQAVGDGGRRAAAAHRRAEAYDGAGGGGGGRRRRAAEGVHLQPAAAGVLPRAAAQVPARRAGWRRRRHARADALRAGGGRGADRPLDRRAARLVPQDRGRVQGEAGGGGAAAAAAPRGGARVGDARAAHAGGEGESARAAPARARHVLVGEAGAAGRGDRAAARARALLPRREDGARAILAQFGAQF